MSDFDYESVNPGIPYEGAINSQNNLSRAKLSPNLSVALKSYQGSFGKLNAGGQMMIGGMSQIGLINDDTQKALMTVQNSLNITYAAFLILGAIKKLRDLKAAAELTLATAESTAYVASIVNSWRIPVAMGAAISIGLMFGGGYELGKLQAKATSSNISKEADISTPEGRRQVIYSMGG